MDKKGIGNFGERVAENYLKKNGYQILDRNFVFRIPENPQKGEIDIVAKKGDTISFIEVKTLKRKEGFLPEDKVNFSKRKKLRVAAESWLMKNKVPLNSKWQIDVISIKIDSGKKVKIDHFENAIGYE
jgi:putative endonuclease